MRERKGPCYTRSSSSMKHQQVTVQVPATTANLGPAFDCMGMALDIWNQVRVEVGGSAEPRVEVTGEGSKVLPKDTCNLVYRSIVHFQKTVGVRLGTLSIRCVNNVPLERGLGSSAAAIVGGLVAANHLAGEPLTPEQVLPLAVELEGHPDNVTAALFGGIRIVVQHEGGIITSPVNVPQDLRTVLYIPDGSISTSEARAVMPNRVSLADAVFNAGRVALLVNALAGDRPEDLKAATEDRLHQPYRRNLFPSMRLIIREALKAGALGAFVSGSGSTVLALARGREMSIAYEMAEAARKANASGRTVITWPSERGAHVIRTSPEST